MTNSITFSSDLNTLYLIEEQQVVSFPLNTKNGVLISVVQDQLMAVTSKNLNDRKSVKIDTIDLKSTQVQFYFSEKYKQGFIIIIDINLDKGKANLPSFSYRANNYPLGKEDLIIKKVGNQLHLIRITNNSTTGTNIKDS